MFKFKEKENIQWCKLGPRAMFGKFMSDIAKKEKKLIVISADLGRSSGLDRFKKEFPDQYLSVGISEQNMIGVAAGLAREGFKVFVTSFAPFLSMRASEQVRMNLGYMKHNVNLVALGSGVGMGFLGNSHFGLEDLSIIRAIPNIKISAPADSAELGKILYDYTYKTDGPSYIRLTGIPGCEHLYNKDYNYKFGKNEKIIEGKDILIISSGSVTGQAKIAAENLKKQNISVGLINCHSIKPFNENIIKEINKYKYLVILEEHSVIGGLNSIISELIVKYLIKKKILPITLPDKFGPTGDYNFLIDYHGLSNKKIEIKIKNFFTYNELIQQT
tara:strand:+ start:30 stop:1022 length:993 start_codon:yes stop_codon:yes gene_type:complete